MNATVTPINGRDRAVLRAVAAGRAEFSPPGVASSSTGSTSATSSPHCGSPRPV
ncbi:hypothetical protein ACFQV8_20655 [Pseudonocardia benzenivorans]